MKNSAYLIINIYYLKIVDGVTAAGVTKSENLICEVCCLWKMLKIYYSIYQWSDFYNLSFWHLEYKNIMKKMHNA